jgi:recombination protein RecA
MDMGVNHGIVEKSGAFFSYKGVKLGHGRDNVKIYLSKNPSIIQEIESEIRKKVFEKIEKRQI